MILDNSLLWLIFTSWLNLIYNHCSPRPRNLLTLNHLFLIWCWWFMFQIWLRVLIFQIWSWEFVPKVYQDLNSKASSRCHLFQCTVQWSDRVTKPLRSFSNIEKNFCRISEKNRKNRPNFFCSKSDEMKILFCKVGMGITLYETKIFDLCCEKIELM